MTLPLGDCDARRRATLPGQQRRPAGSRHSWRPERSDCAVLRADAHRDWLQRPVPDVGARASGLQKLAQVGISRSNHSGSAVQPLSTPSVKIKGGPATRYGELMIRFPMNRCATAPTPLDYNGFVQHPPILPMRAARIAPERLGGSAWGAYCTRIRVLYSPLRSVRPWTRPT